MSPIVNVKAFHCLRCNHIWLPRDYANKIHNEEKKIDLPIACSKCKSPYWNREPIINKNKSKIKKDKK